MGKSMGFYGQLADWVDIRLLKAISQRFPDWTLMLIGAIHTDTEDLLLQGNVTWCDAIDHSELAAYCQHWDIALLPFKPCEQITHCNPLKLKEYLATGTDVVSLKFPAAERYREWVQLADNADHFIRLLDTLINQPANTGHAVLRQSAVQQESWEAKTRIIRQLVASRSTLFSEDSPVAAVSVESVSADGFATEGFSSEVCRG